MTINASTTFLDILYNSKNITELLTKNIVDWTYTDNLSGEIDSLDITLQDVEHKWIHSWFPSKGSLLTVNKCRRHDNNNIVKSKLGKYEIDDIEASGPGVKVKISALSTSEKTSLRKEEKSRSWEKATVKTVASDIAKRNNMQLIYKAESTEIEDRIEQDEQTDLKFLYELCKKESFCLKITSNAIVILDEVELEKKAAIATISRKSSEESKIKVLDWRANSTLTNVYHSCTVKYKDTKLKKSIEGSFVPLKPPKTSRILIVKEQCKTVGKAQRLAKKKLREANKNATTVSLQVYTERELHAGETVNLIDFGFFDGKYIISRCVYANNNVAQIELRRCLEGY